MIQHPRPIILALFLSLLASESLLAGSLLFHGNPSSDDHRVKIRIDDPTNSDPGPPADIGSEDFTLEFWMKATDGNNASAGAPCEPGWGSWIYGNIIVDRDRFNQGQSYGISIVDGAIWFGLDNSSQTAHTICGTSNVLDNQWHHIAVQRRISDGWIQLYIDGELEAEADGPDGDISYPDDGVPGNYCSGPCDFSDPYLVIGAEKHDADLNAYPSYSGYIDEIRLSNNIRYSGSSFTLPSQAFTSDSNTVALYHLDEGSGIIINDTSGAIGGPSNGEVKAGVEWATDTPFSSTNPSQVTIQLTETSTSVNESGINHLFTVTRIGSFGAVSVEYEIGSTGSTATLGLDYISSAQQLTGTLTWANGNSDNQTLRLEILDDSSPENDELIRITLRNPGGGANLGTNVSSTLTILDNDTIVENGASQSGGALGLLQMVFLILCVGFIRFKRG